MEISFDRWYDAIFQRRSRRQFERRQINSQLFEKLQIVCDEFSPFTGARAVLLNQSPENVFKGAIGKYGKIKNAPSVIVFIGNADDPNMNEKTGFTGEGIILEATALGLATCWVAGFFRPEAAAEATEIRANEKVLAVSPVGYAVENWTFEEKIMSGFGRSHKRKPLNELINGFYENMLNEPNKTILEAARLAPSAVNRQPWRFKIDDGGITVSTDNMKDTFNISKRLDSGIAMLHIETAGLKCGIKGKWELLKAPRVAKFIFI